MDKRKVLWVGDAVAKTGFSRVTQSILDELVKMDTFDIHVLGVNYFGDPHNYDYNIYPASAYGSHVLGFQRLPQLIESLQPDVVVLFNDIWVINQYLESVPEGLPVVSYSPIDAVSIKKSWLHNFYEKLSFMAVYTKFAYDVVKGVYPLLEPAIIPHGVDFDRFYPIDGAREKLDNVSDDWWVVLNAHRNQPRKRIDCTIRAFTEFAKDKPDNVKLYLHMALQDAGWDIFNLWEREELDKRIIITNPSLSPQSPVSDETLNIIYNASDIGLNTSLGEGWGLPNFEHAATNHVQIVPNSSACAEIFADDRGLLIDVYDQPLTNPGGINTDGKLIKEASLVEQLQWAYEHPEECKQISNKMFEYLQQPQFKWSNIAKQFAQLLVLAINK